MMLFNIALFGSLLLASIARATLSVFHRGAFTSHDGGVVVGPPKPVLSVVGGISIPMTLTGNEGDQVFFSVGVDSFKTSCSSSSFQLGIIGTIGGNGQPSYKAVYHDPPLGDDGWQSMPLAVAAGDYVVMVVTVNSNDMTSGFGTITNTNKTGVPPHGVNFSTGSTSSALCSHTGGWSIQTRQTRDHVKFTKVEFLQADVTTVDGGMYYPDDPNFAHIVNITDGNDTLYGFKTKGNIITAQRQSL